MGIARQERARKLVRIFDFSGTIFIVGTKDRRSIRLLPPVSDWKHARFAAVAPRHRNYYSFHVTVLSGLTCARPSHVATEVSVRGKIMWRKPEEGKPAAPAANVPTQAPVAAPRVEPTVRSVAGLTAEIVQPSGGIITSTILIKGEISGSEDLYIDGEVKGTIELSSGRVTIGPHGKISADVDAAEILVRGQVTGSLLGRDRVEIGSTGQVKGDISTPRISIGEGAQLHGKVEIERAGNSQNASNTARNDSQSNRAQVRSAGNAPSMPQAAAMKAGADNGD